MKREFFCGDRAFGVECAEGVSSDISLISKEDGVSLYKIGFGWKESVCPEKITLSYSIPAIDVYYVWDAIEKLRAVPFGNKQITQSRLGYGMPLKAALSRSGKNAHCIALADVKSPISIRMFTTGFSHGQIYVSLELFTALTGPFEKYETVLRIDERHLPLAETVYSAKEWFDSLGYRGDASPNDAGLPMYSTWYSYGQEVTADDVLKECRLAAKYGMKAVILDDGWQTDSSGEAYGYCGDWKPIPRKFPDMKALAEEIHALEMKLMVWYSVPFMGFYAERVGDFEGKYLKKLDNANCYVLDPRYKEVRDFLIGTYVRAVKEWKLDGLKLDFIDRFAANGECSPEMDFTSVEDATEKLLSDISAELRKIDPEILIEFRQPYFGPVISKYGNMMRVWDCPLDGGTNKNQTINLRLISGECAVHADMMYWHGDDTAESVARQLWGTVFSVPQISARLGDMTAEQSRALENYLSFWTEHRDTLLYGRMSVSPEENGYGYAESVTDKESITLMSASPIYKIKNSLPAYVINITGEDSVILRNDREELISLRVIDAYGDELGCFATDEKLKMITLPVGGRLEINKK